MDYRTDPGFQQHLSSLETKYGIPQGTLNNTARIESSFNPGAVGPETRKWGRAKGMFQFIDDTAQRYGLSDPFDPYQAADASARYWRDSLERRNGDMRLAIMDYNWGPGNTNRYIKGQASLPTETANYIAKWDQNMLQNPTSPPGMMGTPNSPTLAPTQAQQTPFPSATENAMPMPQGQAMPTQGGNAGDPYQSYLDRAMQEAFAPEQDAAPTMNDIFMQSLPLLMAIGGAGTPQQQGILQLLGTQQRAAREDRRERRRNRMMAQTNLLKLQYEMRNPSRTGTAAMQNAEAVAALRAQGRNAEADTLMALASPPGAKMTGTFKGQDGGTYGTFQDGSITTLEAPPTPEQKMAQEQQQAALEDRQAQRVADRDEKAALQKDYLPEREVAWMDLGNQERHLEDIFELFNKYGTGPSQGITKFLDKDIADLHAKINTIRMEGILDKLKQLGGSDTDAEFARMAAVTGSPTDWNSSQLEVFLTNYQSALEKVRRKLNYQDQRARQFGLIPDPNQQTPQGAPVGPAVASPVAPQAPISPVPVSPQGVAPTSVVDAPSGVPEEQTAAQPPSGPATPPQGVNNPTGAGVANDPLMERAYRVLRQNRGM